MRIFRKRWSLILGCFFPVSILKQKSAFLQILERNLRKKCKSVTTIYIYATESSHCTFSENDMMTSELPFMRY